MKHERLTRASVPLRRRRHDLSQNLLLAMLTDGMPQFEIWEHYAPGAPSAAEAALRVAPPGKMIYTVTADRSLTQDEYDCVARVFPEADISGLTVAPHQEELKS